MVKTYCFLLDKEISGCKRNELTVDRIVEDFTEAGIEVLGIKDEIKSIFEFVKVRVDLGTDFLGTRIRKFCGTRSYKYLI
jgi:phage-related protein